jgi:hypothetical protein
MRLLLVRRQIAAVVSRSFLIPKCLESILEIPFERLIEFVRLHPQRFFVGILAAADDALAQRKKELAHTFRAVLRLDEFIHRVAEVVGHQPGVAGIAIALGLGHLRHEIGDSGVADHHEVDRIPLAALELGAALVNPQRDALANEPLRDDVVLELVRELVRDQPVQVVGRIVDGEHHALTIGFGERRHPFLGGTRRDVLLLEFAVGLENDERDLERQVVLEIGADVLICAFGVAGHTLEVLFDVGVVVDLEVVGGVDVPVEAVVVDVVFPEIRNKRRLCGGQGCPAAHKERDKHGDGDQRASSRRSTRGQAHAHKQYLWESGSADDLSEAIRARRGHHELPAILL